MCTHQFFDVHERELHVHDDRVARVDDGARGGAIVLEQVVDEQFLVRRRSPARTFTSKLNIEREQQGHLH